MPSSERLELRYIPLPQVVRWDRNPKKHDLGAICRAIEAHGFIDPPKFDPTLNGGDGGLLYGNGRSDALTAMHAHRRPLPRGIAVDDDGVWHLPVIFGVDAVSQIAAEQAAVDHNNLTMSGGEYTALDMSRMWEQEGYLSLLHDLAEHGALPVTVDGDDLDTLLAELRGNGVPDFQPVGIEEQGRLDEKKRCVCPNCGHEFAP